LSASGRDDAPAGLDGASPCPLGDFVSWILGAFMSSGMLSSSV
jgi:hypothetical protein